MNKLEIAAHLLSLRDPKVLKKDHKLTEKAFNLKLFDAVYRKGPDHYGAGLEGFETWIVMLAIASFVSLARQNAKSKTQTSFEE